MNCLPNDWSSHFKWIDFHTHNERFDKQVLGVVSLEAEHAVHRMAFHESNTLFTVGLHPWRLDTNEAVFKRRLNLLRNLAKRPYVVGLGEAGLDRLHGPGLECQCKYFSSFLALADELNKTVVVHCVRCFPELLAIKKLFPDRVRLMIHGFDAKTPLLEQLIRHNCRISLGPRGVERDDVMDWFRNNPGYLSALCLETDDSGIDIKTVYEQAARRLQIAPDELSRIMQDNFKTLFDFQ